MNLDDESSAERPLLSVLDHNTNNDTAMKPLQEEECKTKRHSSPNSDDSDTKPTGKPEIATASAKGRVGTDSTQNEICKANEHARKPTNSGDMRPETSITKKPSSGALRRQSSDVRLSQDDDLRIRQPVRYGAINNSDAPHTGHSRVSAVLSRYKYYTKLSRHPESVLQMPDHVVPETFFKSLIITVSGEQNSIITIFSLWNTMLGTSLLSMPWAIKEAGFATGIVLLILMATLMFYTSYRVLTSLEGLETSDRHLEFPDVCRVYLGFWAELSGIVSSLLVLAGGMIVYWILMSNFLYNIVNFIYNHEAPSGKNSSISPANLSAPTVHVTCPNGHQNVSGLHLQLISPAVGDDQKLIEKSTYQKVWDLHYTVPFFLVIVVAPIINFKSPTFFTKFNALGTLSVTYMVSFIIAKSSKWGFNMDFTHHDNTFYVADYNSNFAALTGIAALAYFVHNCTIPIFRNQKNPANNVRDLLIAYCLVCITYVFIGVMFYSTFPLTKSCIEDNFLNNISDQDVLAFIARIGLFFQMLCVFPLLTYIFRSQLMHSVFGTVWPSLKHVLALNIFLMAICIVFAVFLPHIGKIIGFVGAFCGLVYAITLPCLVYLMRCYYEGTLTTFKLILHGFLILIAVANFIGQFFEIGAS